MRNAKFHSTQNPKQQTRNSEFGTLRTKLDTPGAKLKTRNAKLKTSFRPLRGPGFTLIELLIVVAIIGIIAGIVIPTYQSSVRKANEASAVGTLNAIRVAQPSM